MVSFRSTRLEAILGCTLADATATHIAGLAAGVVPEASDLDFKEEFYAAGDKGTHAMATDVAAMANSGGGLIVIGVAERDGRAHAAPGIDLSEGLELRIRQVIAGLVPVPSIVVRRVPLSDADQGHGFVLIAVPPLRDAPCALTTKEHVLRYPVRNGPSNRNLSGVEVAHAHRQRWASIGSQVDRASEVEDEQLERLTRIFQ